MQKQSQEMTHLKKVVPHAKTPPTKGRTSAKIFKFALTFLNSKASLDQ